VAGAQSRRQQLALPGPPHRLPFLGERLSLLGQLQEVNIFMNLNAPDDDFMAKKDCEMVVGRSHVAIFEFLVYR